MRSLDSVRDDRQENRLRVFIKYLDNLWPDDNRWSNAPYKFNRFRNRPDHPNAKQKGCPCSSGPRISNLAMDVDDAFLRFFVDEDRHFLELLGRRRGQIEDRNVLVGHGTKRRRFGKLRGKIENRTYALPDAFGRFFLTQDAA